MAEVTSWSSSPRAFDRDREFIFDYLAEERGGGWGAGCGLVKATLFAEMNSVSCDFES